MDGFIDEISDNFFKPLALIEAELLVGSLEGET